jgi:hypothetical protein
VRIGGGFAGSHAAELRMEVDYDWRRGPPKIPLANLLVVQPHPPNVENSFSLILL